MEVTFQDYVNNVTVDRGYLVFKDPDLRLTDTDISQIVNLVFKHCDRALKDAMEFRLQFNLCDFKACSLYSRLMFEPAMDCWQYTAGQDYPSEIKALREAILDYSD